MNIEGAIVLLTGANGGIAQQFLTQLLDMKVGKIYACARSTSKLKNAIALDPSKIFPVQLDITDTTRVASVAAECTDVTIVINNAGTSLNQGMISAPNLDSARSEIEVNYFGPLNMCRAFAPILKQNGGGAIVNVLSLLARVHLPFSGSYSASKAAALSMTHGVRAELAAQGTLVVAVMPGTVDTEMAKDWPDPKVVPEEVASFASAYR